MDFIVGCLVITGASCWISLIVFALICAINRALDARAARKIAKYSQEKEGRGGYNL